MGAAIALFCAVIFRTVFIYTTQQDCAIAGYDAYVFVQHEDAETAWTTMAYT